MRLVTVATLVASLWAGSAFAASWNPKEPINGFSRDTFFRSIKALSFGLTNEERSTFRRGMNALLISEFPLTYGMTKEEAAPFLPMALEAAHITLDGRSFGEIMERGREEENRAKAAAVKPSTGITEKQTPNPIERIAALDAEHQKQEDLLEQHLIKVRKCLTDNIPFKARYVRKGGIFDDLELTITNGLDWPLGALAFDYAITKAGRTLPFTEKEMSRTLRGGLKPGESRLVKITVSAIPKAEPLDHLDIRINLLNAGDMQGKSLLNRPKSLFTGGLSDQTCE